MDDGYDHGSISALNVGCLDGEVYEGLDDGDRVSCNGLVDGCRVGDRTGMQLGCAVGPL